MTSLVDLGRDVADFFRKTVKEILSPTTYETIKLDKQPISHGDFTALTEKLFDGGHVRLQFENGISLAIKQDDSMFAQEYICTIASPDLRVDVNSAPFAFPVTYDETAGEIITRILSDMEKRKEHAPPYVSYIQANTLVALKSNHLREMIDYANGYVISPARRQDPELSRWALLGADND